MKGGSHEQHDFTVINKHKIPEVLGIDKRIVYPKTSPCQDRG